MHTPRFTVLKAAQRKKVSRSRLGARSREKTLTSKFSPEVWRKTSKAACEAKVAAIEKATIRIATNQNLVQVRSQLFVARRNSLPPYLRLGL